ncbi:type II secretion system F family protein [Candidatus Pacearchaeota archaeon]|nr:type II secretion system F family protein [Candidatus Pacearchaeota archaeon]
MFKLPFSILPTNLIFKFSRVFLRFSSKSSKLKIKLKSANIDVKAEDYKAMCLASFVISFIFFTVLSLILLITYGLAFYYSFLISIIISIFIYAQQMNYPKLVVSKKTRDIDKNLLPALRALLIQLNSGLTFFDAIKNISKGKYGTISKEFGKAIKEMEAGVPVVEALEKISFENPSIFFRRVLWQLITGMHAGSDISSILKEIIYALSTEQVTEIQAYGARLSPLTMFYMLVAIILPSLGITFVIVLSSFLPILGENNKLLLYILFGFVVFLQIMFLGMIKTRRPALSG